LIYGEGKPLTALTAPHTIAGIEIVAVAADILLIPCRPSVFDLAAIESSVKIAKAAKKPAAFILQCLRGERTRSRAGQGSTRQARLSHCAGRYG
jgi:hypothetical protein